MPPIIIGHGDYSEYRLSALPPEVLEELAARYPLALPEECSPDFDDLAITVAVHAEVSRRKGGGKQERHKPTRRELAQMIVKRGFQQASKQYHPDVEGHRDAQVCLSKVRDELLEACENISNDRPDAAIIIPLHPRSANRLEHRPLPGFGMTTTCRSRQNSQQRVHSSDLSCPRSDGGVCRFSKISSANCQSPLRCNLFSDDITPERHLYSLCAP